MELAPTPLDVEEFKFKLQCRLRVFQSSEKLTPTEYPNLVSAASLYGLVFIGCQNNLQILFSNEITNIKSKNEVASYKHRVVNLSSPITHVTVNCDSSLLCVVITRDGCPIGIVYQITSFLSQNVQTVQEIRLSATPNTSVIEIAWNPSISNVLAACLSDGSVFVVDINPNGIQLNSLPPQSQSKCLCWSPKGKQIVIGALNGSLSQYKPDLKIVKTYPGPPLSQSPNNITIVNVLWVTNYQFIASYRSLQDNSVPLSVIVVNVPKGAPISYVNFEDICYSSGSLQQPRFYFIHQQLWNLVLTASANSMEVAVLGILDGSGGTSWQQWIQSDESRAELPLSASKEETYPIGFAFDTSSTLQLPWGENQVLPPMPILYILSHEGVLSVFNVINLKQDVPMICSPPQVCPDQSGLQYFSTENLTHVVQSNTQPPASNTNTVATQPQFQQFAKPQQPQQLQANVNSNHFAKPQQLQANVNSNQFAKPQQPQQLQANVPNNQFLQPQKLPDKSSQSLQTNNQSINQPSVQISKTFSFANATSTPIIKDFGAQQTKSNFFIPNVPNISSNIIPNSTVQSNAPEPAKLSNIMSKDVPTISNETKAIEIPQSPSKPDETARSENVDNSFVFSLINEELKNFQSEINILLTRCRQINIDVGSDKDKTELVERCELLVNFFNELIETTATQKSEIHSLKQLLIEGFALQEETQSRYKRLSNPKYVQLFKTCEIDPISDKKVSEIKRLLYYVESQLNQVNQSIDEEWNDFQDSCQRVAKNIYHTPTLEAIYQSMIKQNEIILRQNFLIKDIKARVKSRARKQDKMSLLMNLKSDGDLPNLIDNLKNLNVSSNNDVLLAKYQYIEENQQKFTTQKEDKLRTLLLSNKLTRITPNKPTKNRLSSSILPTKFVSPKKHIDLLSKKLVSMPIVETTPIAVTKLIDDMKPEAKSQNKVSKKLFDYYENVTPPTTPLKIDNTITSTGQVQNVGELNIKSESIQKQISLFGNTQGTKLFQAPPSSSFSAVSQNNSFGTSNTFQFSIGENKTNNKILTSIADTKNKSSEISASVSNQKTENLNVNTTSSFSFGGSNQTKPLFGGGFAPITTTSSAFSMKPGNSLFGNSTPLFGGTTTSSTSAPTSSSSIFGTSTSGGTVFGSSKTTVGTPTTVTTSTAVSTTPSLFGSTSSTLFGSISSPNKSASSPSTVITSTSNASTPSIFSNISSTSTQSLFSGTKTSTPGFGLSTNISTSFQFVQKTDTKNSPSTVGDTSITTNTSEELTKTDDQKIATSFALGGGNIAVTTTTASVSSSAINLTVGNTSSLPTTEVIASKTVVETTTATLSFGKTITTQSAFTTSTKPMQSLFGGLSTTTTQSLFNSPSTPTTQSLFNVSSTATTPSLFSTPTATTTQAPFSASTTQSIFSTPSTTATQSLFGTPSTTTVQSIFSTPSTTTAQSSLSASNSTTSQSQFSAPSSTTTQSIFSTPSTTATPSPFTAPSSTATQSPFSASSTTTAQSPFGAPSSTTAQSPFGTPSSTTAQSPFGAQSNTTTQSVFSTPSTTTVQSPFAAPSSTTAQSPFSAPSSTTTQSPFGGPSSTVSQSPFGTTSTTTTPSLFGGLNTNTTTQSSFGLGSSTQSFGFGNLSVTATSATTSASNSFNFGNLTVSALSPQPSTTNSGAAVASTSTGGASTFSFVNSAQSNQTTPQSNSGFSFSQNIFNQTPATTANQNTFMGSQICSPSVFSQNTSGSVFGQTNQTQQQTTGNIFGQKPSTDQQSVFGATTNTQNTGSIFAKPTNSNSVFGQQTTNIFGAKPSTPAFGQAPAFGATPTFGSPQTSNIFGSPQTNTNSNSPFGNQNANRSVFGSSQFNNTFKAPTQSQPITGAFSSGGQSISQSGFGSPTAFQKPASGFGSPPAFGSTPAFGSPPTFGGTPTFGSPQKVFGASPTPVAPPAFGSVQQNSTFANLATQNTVGFGNLAQQSSIPQTQTSTFTGGNAFSSWR